ncbi:MAG TPA: hypothetical protein VJU83_08050 [Burkholderiales bacterium]|nr:hypothetical protein [Burkholderiales bacterium]
MNLRLSALDEEIYLAEQLIGLRRQAFEESVVASAHRAREKARDTISSPMFLIGMVGVGTVIGYLVSGKPRRAVSETTAEVKKKSILGMLGAAAFSIAQARFGGPVGLAQWVASKIATRQKKQVDAVVEGMQYQGAPVEF